MYRLRSLLNFSLSQNYPNPFNPSTTINFSLPQKSDVKLVVYDILGKEIKTILNDEKEAGSYHIKWNGLNNNGNSVQPEFTYTVSQPEDSVQEKKMIL